MKESDDGLTEQDDKCSVSSVLSAEDATAVQDMLNQDVLTNISPTSICTLQMANNEKSEMAEKKIDEAENVNSVPVFHPEKCLERSPSTRYEESPLASNSEEVATSTSEESPVSECSPKKKLVTKLPKVKGEMSGDIPAYFMYPCQHCERRFTTKQGLERHLHIHVSSTTHTFKCRYCGKAFGTQINRRRHERHEAGPKKKPSVASASVSPQLEDSGVDTITGDEVRTAVPDGFHSVDLQDCKMVDSEQEVQDYMDDGEEPREQHSCKYCRKVFGTHTNMRRHQRRVHERHLLSKVMRQNSYLLDESHVKTEQTAQAQPVYVTESEEGDTDDVYIMGISSNISENLNYYIDGRIQSNSNTSNCDVIELDANTAELYGLNSMISCVTHEPSQNPVTVLSCNTDSLLKETSDSGHVEPKKRRTTSPLLVAKIKTEVDAEPITPLSSLSSPSLHSPASENLSFHKEKVVYSSSKLKQLLQAQESKRAIPAVFSEVPKLGPSVTPSGLSTTCGRFKRRTSSPPTSPQHSPALKDFSRQHDTKPVWNEGLLSISMQKAEGICSSPPWTFPCKEEHESSSPLGPEDYKITSKEWTSNQSLNIVCNQQPLDLSNGPKQGADGYNKSQDWEVVLDLSVHKKTFSELDVKENKGSCTVQPSCSGIRKRKPTTCMLQKVLLNEYNGMAVSLADSPGSSDVTEYHMSPLTVFCEHTSVQPTPASSSALSTQSLQSELISSAPLCSQYMQSVPVSSVTVSTQSLQSVPVSSATVSTESLESVPVSSATVSTESLQSVPLSSASVSTQSLQSVPVFSVTVSTQSVQPAFASSTQSVPVISLQNPVEPVTISSTTDSTQPTSASSLPSSVNSPADSCDPAPVQPSSMSCAPVTVQPMPVTLISPLTETRPASLHTVAVSSPVSAIRLPSPVHGVPLDCVPALLQPISVTCTTASAQSVHVPYFSAFMQTAHLASTPTSKSDLQPTTVSCIPVAQPEPVPCASESILASSVTCESDSEYDAPVSSMSALRQTAVSFVQPLACVPVIQPASVTCSPAALQTFPVPFVPASVQPATVPSVPTVVQTSSSTHLTDTACDPVPSQPTTVSSIPGAEHPTPATVAGSVQPIAISYVPLTEQYQPTSSAPSSLQPLALTCAPLSPPTTIGSAPASVQSLPDSCKSSSIQSSPITVETSAAYIAPTAMQTLPISCPVISSQQLTDTSMSYPEQARSSPVPSETTLLTPAEALPVPSPVCLLPISCTPTPECGKVASSQSAPSVVQPSLDSSVPVHLQATPASYESVIPDTCESAAIRTLPVACVNASVQTVSTACVNDLDDPGDVSCLSVAILPTSVSYASTPAHAAPILHLPAVEQSTPDPMSSASCVPTSAELLSPSSVSVSDVDSSSLCYWTSAVLQDHTFSLAQPPPVLTPAALNLPPTCLPFLAISTTPPLLSSAPSTPVSSASITSTSSASTSSSPSPGSNEVTQSSLPVLSPTVSRSPSLPDSPHGSCPSPDPPVLSSSQSPLSEVRSGSSSSSSSPPPVTSESLPEHATLKKEEEEEEEMKQQIKCNEKFQDIEEKPSIQDKFNKTFTCNVCDDEFHSVKDLVMHSLVHSEEWPFKCEFCVQLFKDVVGLADHRSSLHGVGKIFVCSLCKKEFAFFCNLQQHQRDLHPDHDCTHYELDNGTLRPQNYTDAGKIGSANSLPDGSATPPQEDDEDFTDSSEELYTTIKIIASGAKTKEPDVRLGIYQHYPSFKPPPFQYHNRNPLGIGITATNFTTNNIPQTFSTAIRCTKCGKSFDNMPDLHKHILVCASASDKKRYTPKKSPVPLKQVVLPKNGVVVLDSPEPNVVRRMIQPKQLNPAKEVTRISVNKMKFTVFKKKIQLVQKAISQKNKTALKQKADLKSKPSDSDGHICPYCNRKFTYVRSLNKHASYSCPKKPPSPPRKHSPQLVKKNVSSSSSPSSDKSSIQRRKTADAEIKLQGAPSHLGKTRARNSGSAKAQLATFFQKSHQKFKPLPQVKSKKPVASPSTVKHLSPTRIPKITLPEGKKIRIESKSEPSQDLSKISQRTRLRVKGSAAFLQKKTVVIKKKGPEKYTVKLRSRRPVTRSLRPGTNMDTNEFKGEDAERRKESKSHQELPTRMMR
ncbi:PR domain zinc finger protein 2-like [Protopterus annectens]|uniref:PR domain zinc finger protein 2-like n=1 Tax=Protopterus annectens TaxID=7888 RepID=UPI001CFBA798|nr:PR domain zinc finger protein 2-like [Protopterus annectens]